ncbi:RNA 2'-phosphotransferase [Methylobacterium bullatum]|uniref:Probable RNA 2'-phosphotransferase n=1 Tax=Methylobacterium bullatum TaxID=570505 RepID=A0A679JFQ7_9HYPH|nr:RNA 2'-phosphotransferase [Methylobacterium bullatum]
MSTETSKFLSYALRHAPEAIGITLGPQGWVEVDTLLAAAMRSGRAIDRAALDEIVATSDKKRFTLSPDGSRIRAAQGHSVEVALDLAPCEPPAILFHGTAIQTVPVILTDGLRPGARRHVHLSADPETAHRVGQRHGKPVVLTVAADRMWQASTPFYRAENGVWLVDHVPPAYLGEFGKP